MCGGNGGRKGGERCAPCCCRAAAAAATLGAADPAGASCLSMSCGQYCDPVTRLNQLVDTAQAWLSHNSDDQQGHIRPHMT
jgi:hypothetical protein